MNNLLNCFCPGLKESFQTDVFKVLAGILHLGNTVIKAQNSEKSSVNVRNVFHDTIKNLLGLCAQMFH